VTIDSGLFFAAAFNISSATTIMCDYP